MALIVAMLTLASATDASAAKRTSKDVRRDKQKNEKQIAQTKRRLEQTDRETALQLSHLESVKADIALRNDTINELTLHLDSLRKSIRTLNDSIAGMRVRQKALKANYGRTLRMIRSRRQGMSDLSFVFSAESFGQAWQRMRSLRQVAKSTSAHSRQLALTQARLDTARRSLESLRSERAASLARHNSVQAALRSEQAAADNLVKNLKKQSKSLQRELERRQRQSQQLDKELDKIVQEEIRLAREREKREAEEARRRAEAEAKARQQAQKPKQKDSVSPREPSSPAKPKEAAGASGSSQKTQQKFESEAEKDRRLSGSFEQNKGRLLFPVEGKHSIVSNFGTNELPELSKVKVDNLGIDIEAPKGASARAIFEGVVSSIFRLDGYNNIIIVRHGEYLSVYAGIDTLAVKKGDKVSAGQKLGRIHDAADSNRSRLHFEIRHEKQKLNPTEWVR